MPWTKKRDPQLPAEPAYHSPTRCMGCGHEPPDHDAAVGCLVEGGTKYLENEKGESIRACTCSLYIAPSAEREVNA